VRDHRRLLGGHHRAYDLIEVVEAPTEVTRVAGKPRAGGFREWTAGPRAVHLLRCRLESWPAGEPER
jgi:hypothetical protein